MSKKRSEIEFIPLFLGLLDISSTTQYAPKNRLVSWFWSLEILRISQNTSVSETLKEEHAVLEPNGRPPFKRYFHVTS